VCIHGHRVQVGDVGVTQGLLIVLRLVVITDVAEDLIVGHLPVAVADPNEGAFR